MYIRTAPFPSNAGYAGPDQSVIASHLLLHGLFIVLNNTSASY